MNVALPQESHSFWMPTLSPTYPSLQDDIEVDTVIIGGGIAGITIGFQLKQAGYRVAVLEKNLIASGTTGGTTGKVSTQHTIIYSTLVKKFGRKNAQIYADTQKLALSDIEAVISSENIDCDWSHEDHFIYTNKASNLRTFQQEVADAASLGLPASFIDHPLELPFPTKGGLKFSNQAKFNASLYTRGLAKSLHGNGSFVFEESEIETLQEGEPVTVKTKDGSVKAEYVILATKIPPGPLIARVSYSSIVYPETSYIVAGETNINIKGMYNTPDRKHYSLLPVQHGDKSYILVGGENHIPGLGIPNRHYRKLVEYASTYFKVKNIEFKWRAMDYIAYDKLPVIGKLYPHSKNIYAVSGFKKWGLTTSMVAARILQDLLKGEESPASKLFYPHRASAPLSIPKAAIEYLK